jgi:hypothetical protein
MITIEQIRENKYDLTKIEGLEIKNYLPLTYKSITVDNIILLCLDDRDGMKMVNYTLKKFAFDFSIMNQYTNIDFSEIVDIYSVYDELCEHGFVDELMKILNKNELDFISETVDAELEQQLKINNSFEGIIAKGINNFIEKLPNEKEMKKMIKALGKDLANFNPEKVDIINRINEIMNTDKK